MSFIVNTGIRLKLMGLISFFLFQISYCQQKELDQINLLLKNSDEYVLNDNFKSLEFAKQANLIAEQIDDSFKIAETSLHTARSLLLLRMYKESLLYIEKGLSEDAVQNDLMMKAYLKELKADNYGELGLSDQELKEYLEIIALFSSKNDRESQRLKSRIDARIASYYLYKKEYESTSKFIDRALKVQIELSKTEKTSELYDLYNIKGLSCLYNKKYDSAYFYLEKSYRLLDKGSEYEYIILCSFGDYYKETGNNEKAIDFYERTLENMKKIQVEDLNYSVETNKNLFGLYESLGNKEQEKFYLQQYSEELTKQKQTITSDIQSTVNLILRNERQHETNIFTARNVLLILTIFVFLVVIIIIFYFKEVKRKKRIQKEKEHIIIQKNKDIHTLEQKLQISLEEIIEEAQKNSPSFLEKFQLLYPQFTPTLTENYSNLNSRELTLLAYIYLNFSTKEIADYTFRSYRTIQSQKYALRKKIGLESKDDFYIWLKSIFTDKK